MASLESFLTSYQDTLTWIFATILFLGLVKAGYQILRAVWKFLRRGTYEIF